VSMLYTGHHPAECLRFGVACGAESTQRLGAGLVDPREVERVLDEIDVQRLEAPAEVS
jgi:fructose-1-phosphate kinase PfkB-like protein